MTEETEIETFDGKKSFERKSGSRCLTEKGLDLYGGTFVMAPTETFTRESFGQCLHFCMTHAPAQSHLLISYYNALLIGDKVSTYLKHTVVLPDLTLKKWALPNFAFQHC